MSEYEGYCVKCKKKVKITEPKETTAKNGILMVKGKCPECETTVCRFLGGKKE